jgi:hypothetical protein
MPVETDATVRRVERTAVYACAVMTAVALAWGRGRPGPPLAVLGGGVIIGTAYWTLKSAVSSLSSAPGGKRSRVKALVNVTGRYALLGFLAYVMIARLRLHPLWLLAGVSSFVAAVSIEALRLLIRKH